MMRFVLVLGLTLAASGRVRAEPLELSPAVVTRVREIHASNPDRRDDAFSKMGGSSVASKAFLHCFASRYVDLGEREELAATLEFFDSGRRNSFNRQSEAAGVSWNLRYVLAGRPANFRREANANRARWALVLFGGNDAQNENERIYVRRLVYLVEELEEMGVVPILGAALPRRNTYKDRWISRFNAITEAVARHWSLPFIDYHGALSALPRRGLARDGVHPNVLGKGGVSNACRFTERGLRYGNNVRNLLTLQMLDALRRTVADTGPVADMVIGTDTDTDTGTDTGAVAGTGTDTGTVTEIGTDTGTGADTDADPGTGPGTDTVTAADTDTGTGAVTDTDTGAVAGTDTDTDTGTGTVTEIGTDTDMHSPTGPAATSVLITKPGLLPATVLPTNCGRPRPGSRIYRMRLPLEERTRLRVSALDLAGYKPRVFWVLVDEAGERCVRRRVQTLEVDARPGMWDLIVEVPERSAQDGQMLVLITRNPR